MVVFSHSVSLFKLLCDASLSELLKLVQKPEGIVTLLSRVFSGCLVSVCGKCVDVSLRGRVVGTLSGSSGFLHC